ncbi:DUF427 domain-containing protein [Allochromatium palmeri]|uniref:DUF427 domain-containing protein n=1 Tax=Allochromatium palmeri TaxID=231048 RepID=UPI0012D73D1F|nr:DUF427 domain-containing protein [Allochromatium palmeri]
MSIDQEALERARAAWTFRGQQRPAFAHVPGAGQESVWDYPRPPLYVRDARLIEIHAGNRCLARSDVSIRVLETGSPPSVYLPFDAFDASMLRPSPRRTLCEWKGEAHYWHVQGSDGLIRDALWSYPDAEGDAAVIAGWLAAYPARLRCVVAGETVRPQAGGYYGGWITAEIVGPFKGEPGTRHW